MGVSCGASVITIILVIFNFIWLALGGVILWLGIKIAIWSGDLGNIQENNWLIGACVVILVGVLIVILAFLGCCGAIKQSPCMLCTYGFIILILVILEGVGAYFAFTYKHD
ncbi:unnamed protein product, partial [Oppiella nova]